MHRHLVDVHVILLRAREVLLTRRRGAVFDGMWHLPSGKLEAGEDALSAACREAAEEIAVHIRPADLAHVHTVHAAGSGQEPRLGLFFRTTRWSGAPSNAEPDKCSGLAWFALDRLPADLIPYTAAGLTALHTGESFSATGW